MRNIIVLTGHHQVGKGTLAEQLSRNYDYRHIAVADPLYDLLSAMDPTFNGNSLSLWLETHDWTWLKTNIPEVRRMLNALGQEIRLLDDWLLMTRVLNDIHATTDNVVISDVYLESELDIFVQDGLVVQVVQNDAPPADIFEAQSDAWSDAAAARFDRRFTRVGFTEGYILEIDLLTTQLHHHATLVAEIRSINGASFVDDFHQARRNA